MKEITEPRTIYFGQIVAKYSAILGTIILLGFLFTDNIAVALAGLAYTVLAALVNGIIVLTLLFNLIYYIEYRPRITATILFMLLNIPLSLIYFYIVVTLI